MEATTDKGETYRRWAQTPAGKAAAKRREMNRKQKFDANPRYRAKRRKQIATASTRYKLKS